MGNNEQASPAGEFAEQMCDAIENYRASTLHPPVRRSRHCPSAGVRILFGGETHPLTLPNLAHR